MGNCLVTKLKSSVNSNLPYIDAVRLEVDKTLAAAASADQRVFIVNSWEANKLVLRNIGGTFTDSSGTPTTTEITIDHFGGDNLFYYSADTDMILIVGKDYIRDLNAYTNGYNIQLLSVDFVDLEGCFNLRQLHIGATRNTGNLNQLKSDKLNILNINGASITGNINAIANCPISYFVAVTNSTLSGDFSSWAAARTEAGDCTYICDAGSVENIKFNGTTITSSGIYTIHFDGNGGFTYTKQS